MYSKLTRGFTLVELMTSIAIIAILTAGIVVSLTAARENARDARRISDVGQLKLAVETYKQSQGTYPTTFTPLEPLYLDEVPTDPQTGNDYTYDHSYDCNGTDVTAIIATVERENNASTKCGKATTDLLHIEVVGPAS